MFGSKSTDSMFVGWRAHNKVSNEIMNNLFVSLVVGAKRAATFLMSKKKIPELIVWNIRLKAWWYKALSLQIKSMSSWNKLAKGLHLSETIFE